MCIRKNKIKMALCFIALLFVCSCRANKQSPSNNPPEDKEQTETVQADLPEEAEPVVQPEAIPPANATEPKEDPEEEPEEELEKRPIEPVLTVWPDADTAAIEAYRAILQENATFVNTTNGEYFDITRLKEMTAPYVDYPVEADSFSLVDLDHDGTPELILLVPIGATVSIEILRYEDGIVYAFGFSDRACNELRKNGTFWASGGANESGICSITFSKDQCTVDKFTYCTIPDYSIGEVKYFVDHKEVSEAECSLATDEWMELPYADWYECVDENIDVVFSLDINDT